MSDRESSQDLPETNDSNVGGELAVDVRNLSRTFRAIKAVDNVTLRIPVGSIFGLVGLNGAGKTTLIQHLIGSLKPQSGSVSVLGCDPVGDPEGVLKEIGYLTEEDSLPQWMSVGELIDFSRAIYPSWDDAYATELLEMFVLDRGARLRSLSKGQRARAGLLVAIAFRPKLLILDEPGSGLDPIARRDILEAIIRTISQEGRTVLFSSHLLDEVDRVCDAIALMNQGRILESLTAEQLETRYREIVCRPREAWNEAPDVAGVFGWQRSGSEWSAVTDVREFDVDDAIMSQRLSVIETRDISLDRWFAARALTNSEMATGNADDASAEVSANV